MIKQLTINELNNLQIGTIQPFGETDVIQITEMEIAECPNDCYFSKNKEWCENFNCKQKYPKVIK